MYKRQEGANALQVLWKVYVPLAKPIYVAYGLVSVSHHWNNFLWPLIITNSVESRPLTVGLQVFSSTDQGIDWSVITAATLMSAAPLLIAFQMCIRDSPYTAPPGSRNRGPRTVKTRPSRLQRPVGRCV